MRPGGSSDGVGPDVPYRVCLLFHLVLCLWWNSVSFDLDLYKEICLHPTGVPDNDSLERQCLLPLQLVLNTQTHGVQWVYEYNMSVCTL
jgi:hypothetical protein